MERTLLVDLLVEEDADPGQYRYTVRTSDGCRYTLLSRNRKLRDAIRCARTQGNETHLYAILLEAASMVLKSHDICFDTLELL